MAAPPVEARELYWQAIDVEARLDAEGRLRVRERQTMVFDGDWNGGERSFELRVTQKLELLGLTRLDPSTGAEVGLVKGDLDRVDQFEWHDRRILRWRNRLPSDPPFDQQTFDYVLDYTLTGVVREDGEGYLLDHDFAFADRVGVIERFTLRLELDPVWQSADLPESVERARLSPGLGVRVTGRLVYAGEGRPSEVLAALPLQLRLGLFGVASAAMIGLAIRFRRHEAERGRYEPLEVPETLDRAWLEEHLFHLPAEVIGALWDRKVGSAEVAATLARMVAEGKLASEVEKRGRRQILKLELLARRGSLEGYELSLVEKLFFDGRRETDTEAVKKHYKVDGGSTWRRLLRPTLEARVQVQLLEPARKSALWPWYLVGAVLVLLLLEGLVRGLSVFVIVALLLIAAPLPMSIGSSLVVPYRRWTRKLSAGVP